MTGVALIAIHLSPLLKNAVNSVGRGGNNNIISTGTRKQGEEGISEEMGGEWLYEHVFYPLSDCLFSYPGRKHRCAGASLSQKHYLLLALA